LLDDIQMIGHIAGVEDALTRRKNHGFEFVHNTPLGKDFMPRVRMTLVRMVVRKAWGK
jgi:hypothetical protein